MPERSSLKHQRYDSFDVFLEEWMNKGDVRIGGGEEEESRNDFGKMGLGNLKKIHRFVESSHTNKNIPNRLSHKRRRSALRDVPPRERSSLVVSLTLL